MDFPSEAYLYCHHKMIRSLLGLSIQRPFKILELVWWIWVYAQSEICIRLTLENRVVIILWMLVFVEYRLHITHILSLK